MSAHPRLSNCQTGPRHKSTCKTLSKEQDPDPTLRTACDGCHTAKIRCTGGSPCARCARDNLKCHYSQKSKIGKPRGSLNKKTIERLRQMKEQQRLAPQTPPSTAGSMDVPKTIPPLPSCDEHSELSDTASSKVGDQVTRTPLQFSLGSPSFEDLIFSEEVSQMESWLPDMVDDGFQNGMNPSEILSKPETVHANRESDPMNMRSREDPQNASSISYKPLPLETFACPSPQSNESSPFGFTIPITTGPPPHNSIVYISKPMRLFLNTKPSSLHFASDILNNRTRPGPRHPPNPIPADPPLHSQSIQMPNLPPRHTNTVPSEHDPIPTPEMDARVDLHMRDALHLSGDPAWEISWFHWHGNDCH